MSRRMSKMSKWSLFALAIVLSILYSTANAEVTTSLQSINHPIYGADTITRDPLTDLEWLDWSLTRNRAVSDVTAQLGPGGEFDGFRYATKDEIIALYLHAGFTTLDAFFVGTPEDLDAAVGFVNLLGVTAEFNDFVMSRAFLGSGSAFGIPGIHAEMLIFYSLVLDTGFAGANGGLAEPVGFADNEPSDIAGNALVRAEPAHVPAPDVLVLVSLGIVALIGWRHRSEF